MKPATVRALLSAMYGTGRLDDGGGLLPRTLERSGATQRFLDYAAALPRIERLFLRLAVFCLDFLSLHRPGRRLRRLSAEDRRIRIERMRHSRIYVRRVQYNFLKVVAMMSIYSAPAIAGLLLGDDAACRTGREGP